MNLTNEEAAKVIEALRDIADNYDCDSDGHKYNTGCRACTAKEALAILAAAKDRPQPAVDRLIEAGDELAQALGDAAEGLHTVGAVSHTCMECPSYEQSRVMVEKWQGFGHPLEAWTAAKSAAPVAEHKVSTKEITDAAIECFELGPEDEDDVLRFAMRIEDLAPAKVDVEAIMECIPDTVCNDLTVPQLQAIRNSLNAKFNP